MSDINHIALAREFGAKISEVGPAGFGFFAALRTVEHARSMRTALPDKVDKQHDVLIARAFEEALRALPSAWSDRFRGSCFSKAHTLSKR
jgi:hypothetical protein